MKILYLGDVMGKSGRKIVERFLPGLIIQYNIDVVVGQAENVTHGKGMSARHYAELQEAGIHAFSGGNHSFERADTIAMAKDPSIPVVVPANQEGQLYLNHKLVPIGNKTIAIASLLGYTIPNGYDDTIKNPLATIDELLPILHKASPDAIIINIHSDLSSEKVMMGHYLDGKATVIVGDHWHIPTADARLLPNGSAYITDVGMCGALNSSLGVDVNIAIRKWRGEKLRNKLDEGNELQCNGTLVTVDDTTKKPIAIQQIQKYTD